jgi:hypothetical protein
VKASGESREQAKVAAREKSASLDHDRRNAYGENAKSSRKNIPRSKQISRQAVRKPANQPLARLRNIVDEDQAVKAELESRSRSKLKKEAGFRKVPDRSLRDVLRRRKTGH